MKTVAAIFATVSAATATAAGPVEWQLPEWAQAQWDTLSKSGALELSLRLNPFVWQGDFDGDKKLDVAVLVKRKSDGKGGIAVLWRSRATPTVLGAGTSFTNVADDFSWFDYWGVEESGSLHESYDEEAILLEADGLLVTKEFSSSGLIYFVDGKPRWLQQGD